ncbi:MAG: low-specificity L-threonine aldolase [Anaerolineales bacterium]
MKFIDLRSDTVTHPTETMRQAMATAEVGDDVYGDDPTVNRLEAAAAEKLGKEAAVFVPSGTMGNLAAVLAHCQRGHEVILGDRAHQHIYEAGGMAALGGIHPRTVANTEGGELPLIEVEAAIRPDDIHQPPTRLICLENTHNLCWGNVLSVEYMRAVHELAQEHQIAVHLDGARLFNAAAALSIPASTLAAEVDSVTFCLSKGLCAPVGSILCGRQEFIARARRMRKMLGGGMRQAGVLAAAGIVALEQMVDRLVEDHERATQLALGLSKIEGIEALNPQPATNMVYLGFDRSLWSADMRVEQAAAEAGIKLKWRGGDQMRLVTHYWIDDQAVETVVDFFRALR